MIDQLATSMQHTDEELRGRPDYRRLKERMKADFKQIRKAVKKGKPLPAALIRTFCADALLMTTYPGKGDEYYTAFRAEVGRLAMATEANDAHMLAQAVAALRRMEKACHGRFK